MRKPRIPVAEIECPNCGGIFGQTAFEKSRNMRICSDCAKIHRATRAKVDSPKKYHLEVLLPKTMTPFFDARGCKGEWCMRVKVRKRGTDEPYARDRIYLGLGKDATPEAVKEAFTAAYARMQMIGATDKPRDTKPQRKPWVPCDPDYGINRFVVKSVRFTVYLPDPLVDGKKHYFGRYKTKEEARAVRDAKYKEMKTEVIPCKLCGVLPVVRNGTLTHFSSECQNRVQMPTGVKPLYQAKLWNLVFSTGEVKDAGKLTKEDLRFMGYFRNAPRGGEKYYPRQDVEFNFSLAAKYAGKPRKKWTDDVKTEDAVFE